MRSKYCNQFCIRFDYGVPLEDIFPPDDIHPRLKSLFHEAYMALSASPHTLHQILGNPRSSQNERSSFKNDSLNGTLDHRNKYSSPESFFWLIRHFLGVLPLPLFPKYTHGNRFPWDYLAINCKTYSTKHYPSLNLDIARQIKQLPKAHKMLICYLLEFLNKIIIYRTQDKAAIITLVEYFTSSLFVRPYRTGYISHRDRTYFPLTYYLIVKWSTLKTIGNLSNFKTDSKVMEYYHLLPTLHYDHNLIQYQDDESSFQLSEISEADEFDENLNKPLRDLPSGDIFKCDLNKTISKSDLEMEKSPKEQCEDKQTQTESAPEKMASIPEEEYYNSTTNVCTDLNLEKMQECETPEAEYEEIQEVKEPTENNQINRGEQEELLHTNTTIASITHLNNEPVTKLMNEFDQICDLQNTEGDEDSYFYDDYQTFTTETFNQITLIHDKPNSVHSNSKVNLLRSSYKKLGTSVNKSLIKKFESVSKSLSSALLKVKKIKMNTDQDKLRRCQSLMTLIPDQPDIEHFEDENISKIQPLRAYNFMQHLTNVKYRRLLTM